MISEANYRYGGIVVALVFHKLLPIQEALRLVDEKLEGIKPLGSELLPLSNVYGRVLAEDVYARVDSPPFDRSTVDGYAVIAEDTYAADESNPVKLRLIGKVDIGSMPNLEISPRTCVEISTGAMIPRGANAVVMVEYTKIDKDSVLVFRGVSPGENIAQTGSDASIGDLILRRGRRLGAREVAALAAVGCREVKVFTKPRAALFSTGNELTPITENLEPGKIYDVNSYALRALLRDMGIDVDFLGILPDSYREIKESVEEALKRYDIVITSGSTSAGFGDIIYKVFEDLGGVLVHGLKIKPGKPMVIGATEDKKLLIGLPGFPLSAMMIFIVLVKPILMKMLGLAGHEEENIIRARIPFRVEVGRGKRNLLPVQIVSSPSGLVAYPLLGDSGTATTLSISDGFIDVDEEKQYISEGEEVEVRLFQPLKISSISIIGSHCPALDILLDEARIWDAKLVNVGSMTGWRAIKKGEADIAGTHLLDPETGLYNVHMLKKMDLEGQVDIFRGYIRTIGLLIPKGNPKKITSLEDILREDIIFVNRVKGSGVRTYLDIKLRELGVDYPEKKIRGYSYEVKTHTAVASAVSQGRADVGISLGYVAEVYGLDFIPLTEEFFDFAIRRDRLVKDSVKRFVETLKDRSFHEKLRKLPYYKLPREIGEKISN
ncbi:MAG: molybdopterin biosynthesis protein [Candidatus Caldarchaeales archaeon]